MRGLPGTPTPFRYVWWSSSDSGSIPPFFACIALPLSAGTATSSDTLDPTPKLQSILRLPWFTFIFRLRQWFATTTLPHGTNVPLYSRSRGLSLLSNKPVQQERRMSWCPSCEDKLCLLVHHNQLMHNASFTSFASSLFLVPVNLKSMLTNHASYFFSVTLT